MTTLERPSVDVAVVMRKERVLGRASRWQTWRWVLGEVLTGDLAQGSAPRLLIKNDTEERWLHTGFKVELFADEAEGYYLNATTDHPCWFVFWRMQEEATFADEPMPVPHIVTLSYHEAGRWLDAQETVEQVPAPVDIVEWLRAFVEENHVAELKRRKRPESFRPLEDRFGNPASVSTASKTGGMIPGAAAKSAGNTAGNTADSKHE